MAITIESCVYSYCIAMLASETKGLTRSSSKRHRLFASEGCWEMALTGILRLPSISHDARPDKHLLDDQLCMP